MVCPIDVSEADGMSKVEAIRVFVSMGRIAPRMFHDFCKNLLPRFIRVDSKHANSNTNDFEAAETESKFRFYPDYFSGSRVRRYFVRSR